MTHLDFALIISRLADLACAFAIFRQRVDNAKPTRYLHQAMTHLDFALFISRLADLACAFAI